MSLVNTLIRKALIKLVPYESARRLFSMGDSSEQQAIWLNANENAKVPNISINPALYNRYPDFQPEELINGYASYANLSNSQVLATRGADESIELLIRTFCEQGDNILICPPTYGMYEISAQTHGANTLKVPLLANMQLDVESIKAKTSQCKLVFVCHPNNPTGDTMSLDDIKSLLVHCKERCLVVVDEAYIEFCPEYSVQQLINEYDNLVITRTLSKAFGLAGIRCGFTLANRNTVDALKKVIAPYPVPAPVAQIASDALSESGLQWMKEQVNTITQQRELTKQKLTNYSFVENIYASKTNFILITLTRLTADEVMQQCIKQNVLIRNQSKQLGLNNSLRISIGDNAQMDTLFSIFDNIEQSL